MQDTQQNFAPPKGWGEDEQAEANRQTASLAGLAVTLALVAGSLFLIQHLAATSRMEDCLLSGRTNCAPVTAKVNLTRVR